MSCTIYADKSMNQVNAQVVYFEILLQQSVIAKKKGNAAASEIDQFFIFRKRAGA